MFPSSVPAEPIFIKSGKRYVKAGEVVNHDYVKLTGKLSSVLITRNNSSTAYRYNVTPEAAAVVAVLAILRNEIIDAMIEKSFDPIGLFNLLPEEDRVTYAKLFKKVKTNGAWYSLASIVGDAVDSVEEKFKHEVLARLGNNSSDGS